MPSPALPCVVRASGPDLSSPHLILTRRLDTPLGPMLAGASGRGICLLEWTDRRALEAQLASLRRHLPGSTILPEPPSSPDPPAHHSSLSLLTAQLTAYFARTLTTFTVPLHAPGTPFQEQVWNQLRHIPHAHTRSYLDIAKALGRPTATRAVARANGDNRLAILIPCHRVIGSDGSLTGYGGHPWRKRWLLNHEASGSPSPREGAGGWVKSAPNLFDDHSTPPAQELPALRP